MGAIATEPFTTITQDGATLYGTVFLPQNPKAVAILNGATGVPERFYRHFATWLAEQEDIACMTYAYRDMHDPSPRNMRASQATMRQWALLDPVAVRRWSVERFSDLPLWMIGHSLGGMMIAKQEFLEPIERIITVGSGFGYLRDHPFPFIVSAWMLWHVLGYWPTRILGYLPGQTIGLGSTLPAGAFWEWRRWCTLGPTGFLLDTSLPEATPISVPLRLVATSDDPICPTQSSRRLQQAYPGADASFVELSPQDAGLKKLGHFGLFRPEARAAWPTIIAAPQSA